MQKRTDQKQDPKYRKHNDSSLQEALYQLRLHVSMGLTYDQIEKKADAILKRFPNDRRSIAYAIAQGRENFRIETEVIDQMRQVSKKEAMSIIDKVCLERPWLRKALERHLNRTLSKKSFMKGIAQCGPRKLRGFIAIGMEHGALRDHHPAGGH